MKENNSINNFSKRNVDNRTLKVIRGGADKMSRAATMSSSSASVLSSENKLYQDIEKEDIEFKSFKEASARLSQKFHFSDDEINKATKEVRKECWKL